MEKTLVTIEATVNAPAAYVWKIWTDTNHITKWNSAHPDWHSPKAEHDLREGGTFSYRMEAKDGSFGFDFGGVFDVVKPGEYLEYTLGDGRKVKIDFTETAGITHITETFEAENENPVDMQKGGWQAILDNFKKYTEEQSKKDRMHFEIVINAPVEKVYKTMLNEQTYREWTAAFNPTSHFKGSWDKGSKILFIGTGENGEIGGMVGKIRENIPNRFVSITYLGEIKGDKEITSGPEVESWIGAQENYSFIDQGGKTLLSADIDMNEEFKEYFEGTWPKALQLLKTISEK